jgi:predicted nucleic acid-binding protein
MNRFILDASVVTKWVLADEPNEDNALRLLNEHLEGSVQLYAPSLLMQEVANSLWKAVRRKRISEQVAQNALSSLKDVDLALEEFDWLQTSKILTIASARELTVYDSSYLFLSELKKAPLITADNLVIQKAKEYFDVLHIKDYA